MTNVQPPQVIHTKTTKPLIPPRPHRPIPSPSMRPSPPVAKNTHPQWGPTTIIQLAATVIHVTIPDTVPTTHGDPIRPESV